MRGGAVRWVIKDKQWSVGCAALPAVLGEAAKLRVRSKVHEGFRLSQERVHVQSGQLRGSGRVEEINEGARTRFEVMYGGEEYGVDYAGYEELLHPFLEPAMAEVMGTVDTDVNLDFKGTA